MKDVWQSPIWGIVLRAGATVAGVALARLIGLI